jgi:hypothetical protein
MKLIKINNQENKFNQVKIVVQTMMQNVLNGEVSDTTGDAMKRCSLYHKEHAAFIETKIKAKVGIKKIM